MWHAPSYPIKRIALADWPMNHDAPLLLYPDRFVKSVNTKEAELIGARCTTGIKMAKNPTTWRMRMRPSRLGRNLTSTVLVSKVMKRTAYKMRVACHLLGT